MSNAKFRKTLINELKNIGYEKYLGNQDLYFVKYVGDNFYNILFIYYSNINPGSFTGDLFLSLYPSYIYDRPGKRLVYRSRVGQLLKKEERIALLNNEKEIVNRDGGDAWWYKEDEHCIEHFVESVQIATPRFIARENIRQQVLDNEFLRWFYNKDMRKIIELANALTDTNDSREYTLIPKTDPDKIGMKWFKASEIFLKEHTEQYDINIKTLKELASKAYMTDKYEKLNGPYNSILLDLKQKDIREFLVHF